MSGHDGGSPRPPIAERLRAWIPAALLLLAGVIVYLPALRSSYFLDDYVQASMAAGTFPRPRSPFDLYDFINDADRSVLQARGLFPWWSDPHVTLRFFRPLSSVLVWPSTASSGTRSPSSTSTR